MNVVSLKYSDIETSLCGNIEAVEWDWGFIVPNALQNVLKLYRLFKCYITS